MLKSELVYGHGIRFVRTLSISHYFYNSGPILGLGFAGVGPAVVLNGGCAPGFCRVSQRIRVGPDIRLSGKKKPAG